MSEITYKNTKKERYYDIILLYIIYKEGENMAKKLHSLYELLDKTCNFYISRYYCQNFTTFYMDLHEHTAFEIMYVTKGSCDISYIINNKQYYTYLKQGEFIFIDCNIPHMLKVNTSSNCRILNLEIDLLEGINNKPGITHILNTSSNFKSFLEQGESVIIFRDLHEGGVLQEIMHNIHMLAENESAYQKDSSDHLLLNLELLKLLTLISQQYMMAPDDMLGLHYIKKAKEYIDANFDHDIAIITIANHVGISSAYLQRLFSKQVGMTITDYIINKRIHKSTLLLRYTDAMIIDIAMDVGFNSRQHFTYTFKKLMNISPQQFRNKKDTYEIPFTANIDALTEK